MQRTLDKLRAGGPATIVALGDSNTEPTFHTRGHLNWVGLLHEALVEVYGRGCCTMINAGVCGSSYRDALARLERDVLRHRPDLVIVALGMNDATAGLAGLPAFAADVRTLVARVRAESGAELLLRTSNPVVTVHGVPLPVEQPRPGRPWEDPRRPLRQYMARLVELAQELDCPVVDHYTLWSEQRFVVPQPVLDPTGLWPRMGDAVHPGALGHMVFYRELAPQFRLPRYFPWEGADTGAAG